MNVMSRRSIREYIMRKREDYEGEFPERKTKFIDEVCRTTGLSRKYVIRLLNGKVEYRERKGRGKTYGDGVVEALKAVWRSAGCPCLPYFKARIGAWVEEYTRMVAPLDERVAAQLVAMSDRTMSRALSGEVREKPGWSRANRRSGRNVANVLKEHVPCASGEIVMASDVPPGDIQVDTFALGGGDPSENYFWILTCTDRHTQWTELSPAWNRGQRTTLAALERCMEMFPFPFAAIHSDNGGEILNYHVMAYLGKMVRRPFVWRSRARKSNDNAHVEEKNQSVGRQLFGEIRLDCPGLEPNLIRLCGMWSDFVNFFRPCKMLVAKERRADGKGSRCRYDKPRTPYERCMESKSLTDAQKQALAKRREGLSGIDLLAKIRKLLGLIRRKQERFNRMKKAPVRGAGVASSALRAAPPGTAASRRAPDIGQASTTPLCKQHDSERLLSAQYLANQKPPDFLSGALSI